MYCVLRSVYILHSSTKWYSSWFISNIIIRFLKLIYLSKYECIIQDYTHYIRRLLSHDTCCTKYVVQCHAIKSLPVFYIQELSNKLLHYSIVSLEYHVQWIYSVKLGFTCRWGVGFALYDNINVMKVDFFLVYV